MFTPETPWEPPGRPIELPWRLLRELAAIAAPGGLLLSAWTIVVNFGHDFGLAGLPATLTCLIVIAAILSNQSLIGAAARGAAQLATLYLCMLLAFLLWPRAFIGTPHFAAIVLGCFAIPPLIPALVLRLFRWRIVRLPPGTIDPPSLPHGFQFRLTDAFAWTTQFAILLTGILAVAARFDQKTENWEWVGYVVIVFVSAIACVPTGMLGLVLTWLILCPRHNVARSVVAVILMTGTIVFVALCLGGCDFMEQDGEKALLFVTLTIAVPLATMLSLAWLTGWQMLRLPRAGSTTALPEHQS